MVGQAAVGKRDGWAFFEDRDFRLGVDSSGSGCGRGSGRDASDDQDALGLFGRHGVHWSFDDL